MGLMMQWPPFRGGLAFCAACPHICIISGHDGADSPTLATLAGTRALLTLHCFEGGCDEYT